MPPSKSVLVVPWHCARCRTRAFPLSFSTSRTFTSTTSSRSTENATISTSTATAESPAHPPHVQTAPSLGVNAYSPQYLNVPSSLQPVVKKTPWIKGQLPKPRNVFPSRRGGLGSARSHRLARRIRSSSKTKGDAAPAQQDVNAYKERMAQMRRENLREGFQALARRYKRRTVASKEKYDRKAEERSALMGAPPSDPDRFTRISQTREIVKPLQHTGQYTTDPNTENRHVAKVARYEAQATRKASETQDALHTLYMRARDFIVTEEQLDKEIDAAFGTQENPKIFQVDGSSGLLAPSVWARGDPPNLKQMMQATGQASGGALNERDVQARARLQEKRLRKVAERLTGGKM